MTASVLAHAEHGGSFGFDHGLLHPLTGLDHILAMVAVGVLAAQCGGRLVWQMPVVFALAMLAAAGLGVAGVPLPLVELGIVGSVVLLGAMLAAGWRLAGPWALALVGFVALFHGYAHGAEMPPTSNGAAYAIGFVLATLGLIAGGLALWAVLAQMSGQHRPVVIRVTGAALATAGLVLLFV